MEGHPQHELTPGQQVLSTIPIGGPERTYTMTSTDKHKVSRGRYLTSNDKRGYIPVYEYPIGDQWIMLDAEDGYVLWTAIWKALGNAKADVVRMLDNMPELTPYIRRVRGGYLKIQGTWMKYEIAEDFSRRVAYSIREDLIPLFGPNFPASCLTPEQPGFGNILPGGRRRKARTSSGIRKQPIPSSSSSSGLQQQQQQTASASDQQHQHQQQQQYYPSNGVTPPGGGTAGMGAGPSAYPADPSRSSGQAYMSNERGPGPGYGGAPSPSGNTNGGGPGVGTARPYWNPADGSMPYPNIPQAPHQQQHQQHPQQFSHAFQQQAYGLGMYAPPPPAQAQQQYHDQMSTLPPPPSSSASDAHHQQQANYHHHPQQQTSLSPTTTASSPYYQAGIPSSSGPARTNSNANAGSTSPSALRPGVSALGPPVRYDPYGTAAKAHHHSSSHTRFPSGGGNSEPASSWNGAGTGTGNVVGNGNGNGVGPGGVPTYGRLPVVDYSRIHLGTSGSHGVATGTGTGAARQAGNGVVGAGRAGPILDPSLVGPTITAATGPSPSSRAEANGENGPPSGVNDQSADNQKENTESSNEDHRGGESSDNGNGNRSGSVPPAHAYASRTRTRASASANANAGAANSSSNSSKQSHSLGLPISSARDDANT